MSDCLDKRVYEILTTSEERLNPLLVAYNIRRKNKVEFALEQAKILQEKKYLYYKDIFLTAKDFLEFIDVMIENGADINIRHKDGYGLLHICHEPEVIKRAVELGGDINLIYCARDAWGRKNTPLTPLILFIKKECGRPDFYDILRLYLELGSDVKAGEPAGLVVEKLSHKLQTKEERREIIKILELLLEYGSDFNLPNVWSKYAPLMNTEDSELISFLVEHGADINRIQKYAGLWSNYNHTPLHYAVSHKYDTEVIKTMLELGADPNEGLYAVIDNWRRQDGDFYPETGRKLIRLLLKYGADIDEYGYAILTAAIGRSPISILKELVELGADVHYVPSNGRTLLHYALEVLKGQNWLRYYNDTNEFVHYLIKEGLDVDAKDAYEQTPFSLACMAYANYYRKERFSPPEHFEILKLLIQSGADINTPITEKLQYKYREKEFPFPAIELLPKKLQAELKKLAEYRDINGITYDYDIDCFER